MRAVGRHHVGWPVIQNALCGTLSEQSIHVLQLQSLGFRKEEEDQRNPGGIEDGKNDVRLPADVVDGYGRDLHNQLMPRQYRLSLIISQKSATKRYVRS
jgi:hypothetical protein